MVDLFRPSLNRIFVLLCSLVFVGSSYTQPQTSSVETAPASLKPSALITPAGETVTSVRELSGLEITELLSGNSYKVITHFYTGHIVEVFYQFSRNGKASLNYMQPQYGNSYVGENLRWMVVGDKLHIFDSYHKNPVVHTVGVIQNGKFVFLRPNRHISSVQK